MGYDSTYAPVGVEVKTELVSESSVCLNDKERLELREILRLSIGDRVNEFSEEDLNDLGMTFLEATAVVLKARYSQRQSEE